MAIGIHYILSIAFIVFIQVFFTLKKDNVDIIIKMVCNNSQLLNFRS
jgi:hypothetical protein